MTEQNKPEAELGAEMGFLSHLIELRDRLLRAIIFIAVAFLCIYPFSDNLYTWLAGPLMAHMPEGASMVAIDVASPFLIPFKMSLMMAVFISVPFLLHQIWLFIAPGLYQSEQRLARPLLISSIMLFYVGVLFAYFVVFPLIFGFFTSVAPEGVEISTDIGRYLDFVITIFFAFGIAFEVPIAIIVLVSMGMATPDSLSEKRPYFIVGAFVVGMLLTPPDAVSQTLLALPMWLLYELGIFFSRSFISSKKDDAESSDAEVPATATTDTVPTKTGASDLAGAAAMTGVPLAADAAEAGSHDVDEYDECDDYEDDDADTDRRPPS